jgi:DNA polymerase
MIKKQINQKNSFDIELLNLIGHDYVFNNNSINRLKNKIDIPNKLNENKHEKLAKLKQEIDSIKDCKLKKNASTIVFADGNIQSSIMLVGGSPGQKEDELGKPFVGEAGTLLNKMLKAIKIVRKKIYITNVVNYRPPNDRKPEQSEINRYSKHLREHISIIDPKILILMGSTAMEAILGINKKISKERGQWKEVIIKQKNYKTIVTFHPAYLLRKPDQKKYSWEDLKIIHKEIDEQNIEI